MSQEDEHAQKRHTLTEEKVNKLLAEHFDSSGTCQHLCDEIENVLDELDAATISQRPRLLARLHALQAQRTSMHCRPCFFK